MQRSAAMASDLRTTPSASSWEFSSRARAAACAYGPPEPIAINPSSGSITSPMPVMISDDSRSATASIASRRRSTRSVRQSLASSTAERIRLPWCLSSLDSKRSNRVKASAVPPAKPARMRSWYRRLTLRALAFTTMLPSVTCPSPPSATFPSRRADRIVVPWNCSMRQRKMGVESRRSSLGGSGGRLAYIGAGWAAQPRDHQPGPRDGADDHGAGRQVEPQRGEQAESVAEHADGVGLLISAALRVVRGEGRHDQGGENEVKPDQLHGHRHNAPEQRVEADPP